MRQFLVLIMVFGIIGCAEQKQTEPTSPELIKLNGQNPFDKATSDFALYEYLTTVSSGDSDSMHAWVSLNDTFDLTKTIALDGYKVVDKIELDEISAKEFEFRSAPVQGDVEYEVELISGNITYFYTYWFHLENGQWRLLMWEPIDLILLAEGEINPSSSDTRRIVFNEGSVETSITDSLFILDSHDYLMAGQPGESVIIEIESPEHNVYFTVNGPTGVSSLMGKGTRWIGKLKLGGDYTIRVFKLRRSPSEGGFTHYTLHVAKL